MDWTQLDRDGTSLSILRVMITQNWTVQ